MAKLADGPSLNNAGRCMCFVSSVYTLCLSSHKWLIPNILLEKSTEQKARDDLHRQMLAVDRGASHIVQLDTEFVDPLMSIGLPKYLAVPGTISQEVQRTANPAVQ